MYPTETFPLEQNWEWKQRNISLNAVLDELQAAKLDITSKDEPSVGWRSVTAFPSEIHVELLNNKLIPDPFLGFNEHRVQWIGEVEWLYKTTFPFNRKSKHAVLEFLGLDTICDVYLNGQLILQSDNQFQSHTIPLEPSDLKPSNVLFLHFKSAAKLAKSIEAKLGKVRAGSTNLGDPSRVYVRKAQYDWRWDWGPELMTCGPYRAITLRTYDARLSEIQTHAVVTDSLNKELRVDINIEGDLSDTGSILKVTVTDLDDREIKAEEVQITPPSRSLENVVDWRLGDVVELWWPVGYGKQHLYRVNVSLISDGAILDKVSRTIGFRTVKLIEEPLIVPDRYGTGTTFLFEVNGSNWIPADNFLTTLTPERYRAWLTLMKEGNQNMVRIWGGGIYEPDIFFELCDELGIMVWHDFAFACGVYPAHEKFLASVKKEAEDNVKRIRHHPSIALFCGNNEDYQMILQWGDVKDFPAIKIYEELLPSVVKQLTSPEIPYVRGSPYGGEGWDTSDPTVGDVHQWNVWGGKERPYQEYDQLGGRFVSEFGVPSMPCMKTIDYWFQEGDPNGTQRYPQSQLMAQHCRAGQFERRFAILVNENLRVTEDLETAVYNTQLIQSEAVGYAYKMWRRKWAGPGKQHTGGVLVWQFNDCWPVTSWAIADYFLRPKPAYYSIKGHLAPIAVAMDRTVEQNRPNDRPRQFYEYGAYQSRGATIDVWAVNATLTPRKLTLKIHAFDLCSTWTQKESHSVLLHPNQATELLSKPCPSGPKPEGPPPTGFADWTASCSVVLGARLMDPETGEVLARALDWPQPYKHHAASDPKLKVTIGDDGTTVTLDVKKPAKCVVLQAGGDGPEVKWSDNAMDLMPGDTRVIQAAGLNGREILVSYMGKEKASRPVNSD